jgi:hypothetical protein
MITVVQLLDISAHQFSVSPGARAVQCLPIAAHVSRRAVSLELTLAPILKGGEGGHPRPTRAGLGFSLLPHPLVRQFFPELPRQIFLKMFPEQRQCWRFSRCSVLLARDGTLHNGQRARCIVGKQKNDDPS